MDQNNEVSAVPKDGTSKSPSDKSSDNSGESPRNQRMASRAVAIFPILILAGFGLGFYFPATFSPLLGGVTIALGIIMFGMGLTLVPRDFALVVKRPVPVIAGVAAQFMIMPLLAWSIAYILGLSPELSAGVILVGCVPGGTSSNVVSYLARGDVALSVTMTSVSTLLSPVLTPLLTLWLAGTYMAVPTEKMAWAIVNIVLIPVVAGLLVRRIFGKYIESILGILPWVSVFGIVYVVVAIVAVSADKLALVAVAVVVAVVLHNGLGYVFGYLMGWLIGAREATRRTMAIEVGMQNSGLAAGLASHYFSPEAALPAAVFSVWHNISGGLLASVLRRLPLSAEKTVADSGAELEEDQD